MNYATAIIVLLLIAVAGVVFWRIKRRLRSTPAALMPGEKLPQFSAQTEGGESVHSSELHGSAAVLLFVRGNWCPFCSAQVENLTSHYKAISELGARLIFVTPTPLETTRRVADFYAVDFDFWLDKNLDIARSLGLVLKDGVPKGHRQEYGEDTVWPTAVVIDKNSVIRYTVLSKFLADRPNPKDLLEQLQAALKS